MRFWSIENDWFRIQNCYQLVTVRPVQCSDCSSVMNFSVFELFGPFKIFDLFAVRSVRIVRTLSITYTSMIKPIKKFCPIKIYNSLVRSRFVHQMQNHIWWFKRSSSSMMLFDKLVDRAKVVQSMVKAVLFRKWFLSIVCPL